MVRQKRIWREWQHPRDAKGRFSRTGGESWAKRAAQQFAERADQRPQVSSAAGRPGIGAKAKAGAILNLHAPGAGDTLSRKFERTPPGTALRTVTAIGDVSEALQVQHEGGWRKVVGHGSTGGTGMVMLQGDLPGETIKVLDAGKPVLTRPYKTEFHEPLRPRQAEMMAQWRADAAKPPAMRVKTTGEQRLEEVEQELAQAKAALKEAQRKARNRANRKYPNKEGYSAWTRDNYIDRETWTEQHAVGMAEAQAKYIRDVPADDKYMNRPSNRLPEFTGTIDRNRPLAVYGDLLHIDADDQGTFRHLADLSAIPAELHALVARSMYHGRVRWGNPELGKSAGVWVGSKPVSQLDHAQDLASEAPRGWHEGATWENVDGVVKGDALIAGVSDSSLRRGEHGQPAAHEFGHALDHAIGELLRDQDPAQRQADASEAPEWRKVWRDAVDAAPNMNPYFKQAGGAGLQEMWAEAFGAWAKARAREWKRTEERNRERGEAWVKAFGRKPTADALRHSGEAVLMREFRIPRDRADVAAAMGAYFEGLLARLGVEL